MIVWLVRECKPSLLKTASNSSGGRASTSISEASSINDPARFHELLPGDLRNNVVQTLQVLIFSVV